MPKPNYFAIGTYTNYAPNAPFACGDGISIISLNRADGEMNMVSQYKDIIDPTYLSWSKKAGKLLSCSENSEVQEKICSFSITEDKSLKLLTKSSDSNEPLCFITSLKTNNTIFSTSYSGGCLYKHFDNSNSIEKVYKQKYKGKSHAHQVVPDINEKNIYICDLGNDRIWIDSVQQNKESENTSYLELPKGYGPRHLVFDSKGEYVYILCELLPILIVAKIDQLNGTLKIIGEYPTIKDPKSSKSAPAAIKIHPSGNTVAVSNRVDNTISTFKISGDKLEILTEFTTKGDHPRDMEFTKEGDWLLIANQNTSDIQIKSFDPDTGEPNSTWGKPLKIGTPVCIVNLGV